MQAKDIMTVSPITINVEEKVEKAAELMTKNNISGLPVVDDKGNLVGIVTEGDLLGKHKKINPPAYFEILGGIILLESTKRFLSEIQKYVSTEVVDLMSKDVKTIGEETTIDEIATIMSENNIKRLPVLNSKNELIGIVSRSDILKGMANDY
ncbi:CBS domain-containing protein [Natranaerofaba carboxydovora]|uniref:CBS domain-containing protein n=1 Tax=Natranaerofaba carboxydovora TaxID=2742683 RepID=UPI001F12AFD9|nr:CBS domain-containing protein [Natranaerofaba carboxydovora]UMZ74889.1 Inosine-5'-monophosphate dehydrogenase [Natranaerofaba carboxydovora]